MAFTEFENANKVFSELLIKTNHIRQMTDGHTDDLAFKYDAQSACNKKVSHNSQDNRKSDLKITNNGQIKNNKKLYWFCCPRFIYSGERLHVLKPKYYVDSSLPPISLGTRHKPVNKLTSTLKELDINRY